ncbi:MAG: PQQ-binding-like beta-propeller repeat protein [Alphaproteobacteria bacterium]|nr:PQQ-binding-like beta-propeller repeat protein [Alphaproteobacteria bacterium]
MKPYRQFVASAVVCAMLAGCSLFGGGDNKASEEERAGRVNMSILDEKLVADVDFAATTVTLPPAAASKDWAQAGVSPAKISGHVAAGAQFSIDWRADAGAGSSQKKRLVAPPVVKDGRVFVIDANQQVSAFDTTSGARVWSRELEGQFKRDTFSVGGGLAVAGDKLLVGSGFGYVVALSVSDGAEVWRRPTESPVSGSPAVVGNRAYVTSTNNELYALNVETGEIIWTDQAIAESARILSAPSPAVSDELLVAPYSSGELIAYVPANGRRLWTDTLTTVGRFTPLSAINDIAGRPVIQDNVVYAASHSGVLTAIDARSGQRIWNMLFGSRLGPVIIGEYLFIVSTAGQVACINKVDGGVIWVRNLAEFQNEKKKQNRIVWTGPLVASDRLVLGSSEGMLVALSPQTGETLTELKVGAPLYIEPIAADGKIFVLTDKGQLVAIR